MKSAFTTTIWILCFGICGCDFLNKKSDTHQAVAQTRYNLKVWGDYVKTCYEADFPIREKKTLEDALALLKQIKINDTDYRLLEKDYWGRKYIWELSMKGGEPRIRIISTGRNGKNENGSGDDLFVDITFEKKKVEINLK